MRRARIAGFLVLAGSASTIGPARAQAAPEGTRERGVPTHVDDGAALEVTVRGAPTEAYTSRVSADDSLRPPVDAASLLAELPSVHVRRLGAEGSFATLSVRGSASAQVGVVLAGIPLTSAADPSFDVGALPLWPGAAFRVYRGFAPAALGTTGYLGGVLSIEPPSPATGASTTWWAAAGSFGALKLRVGDLRRAGDLTLGTGLFASRADGDFPYEIADPITGRLAPRVRVNAGHVAAGLIERVSLELPWGSVGALVLADARRQGLPGVAGAPTAVARLEAGRVVAGLDATARTGAGGALRALLWGRREETVFADPLGELNRLDLPTYTDDTIEAAGGALAWRGRPVDALAAGLTIDARGERFAPEGAGGATEPGATPKIAASRLAGGAGADLAWRIGSTGWTLAATGRLDARRDEADAPLGASTELAPSGHVGASLALSPAAVLAAHAGALRRPPGFLELYGNRGGLVGDPALRPERALSVDAGVHGEAGDAGLRLGWELVGFATAAEDLIAFVPLGRSTFRAENVERATLLGAELSVSLAGRGARSTLSYTLLGTQNTSDDPLVRGRPLPGRPQHDLAYDAAYRFGPVGLRYGLDAVAGTTVDTGGTVVLPARVLHGAGAAIDVGGARGVSISVDVENLFDLRTLYVRSPLVGRPIPLPVSDFLGFPLPGRAVWVSARWIAPGGLR